MNRCEMTHRMTSGVRRWSDLGLEGLGTAQTTGIQKLAIALATVAEAGSDLGNGTIGALTRDEHGELLGENVVGIDVELAAGPTETEGIGIDSKRHGGKTGLCPIRYGGGWRGVDSAGSHRY